MGSLTFLGLRSIILAQGALSHTCRLENQKRRQAVRVNDIPEIARLSTPEKILLVEDLWESIAADESAVPVPRNHKEELDRRFERHQSDPGRLLTLEELHERIVRRT